MTTKKSRVKPTVPTQTFVFKRKEDVDAFMVDALKEGWECIWTKLKSGGYMVVTRPLPQ